MYRNEETTISYRYLQEVIKHLDEPLCLMGGWAVYFLVNENFRKETKNEYLGSRDVDLGFNKPETANQAITKLMELGFKRISFRYFKEIHAETMKELTTEEAKKTPIYNIFPMYVDLIMSITDASMKTKLGFMPLDEPLLKLAFDGRQKEVIEFGRKVLIPTPEVMIAMKIKSIKGRDKEHKRIKDLCDLTALCLYSGMEIKEIREKVHKLIVTSLIQENLKDLNEKDFERVSSILNLSTAIISGNIETLKKEY